MRGIKLISELASSVLGTSGRFCELRSLASLQQTASLHTYYDQGTATPLPSYAESRGFLQGSIDPPSSREELHLPPVDNTPQLCAVPKKRVTLHRRGHRRQWYHLKRKQEYARCVYCGSVGAKDSFFAGITGNSACNGKCMGPADQQYPSEYKPPC
uniref:Uncharacterized protein n=1 Tax=Chlamydomonas leiostraca TaxID=1034604 RepID=A0A7S0WNN7_9CHLO|mmetsp:Transcript_20255/g.51259  ORF Transcript_20255/g.51259 Transcript_20255/m.51259 type:complete len:156 (+) Transcript_20255:1-468(+)